MMYRVASAGLLVVALGLGIGCTSTPSDQGTITVTVQGQYEKRALTASGFGTLQALPTRYAYAEVVDASTNNTVASGILGADGTRAFRVARDSTFYVALFPLIEIPNSPADSGFFFYGGVKQASPSATYANADTFNRVPFWFTASSDEIARSSGTLTLRALESTGEAGAFAIADQMTTFALGLRQLEPGLKPPEMYAFWNPGTTTTLPSAALAPDRTTVLAQTAANGGRVIFQHGVRHAAFSAADRGGDAYNDGVLQEAFVRMLFADSSYIASNGTHGSIIRRDNDNAFVSFDVASEPSMAFIHGFSAFLSCAFRNDPSFYLLTAGSATPSAFRLDQHTNPAPLGGGEFYAGSVSRTLWGLWKNPSIFNGTQTGLQSMWDATVPSVANQNNEYGVALLACFPSYLTGLKRLAGPSAAIAFRNEGDLENVGNGADPTSLLYFNGPTLWTLEASATFNRTGSFPTYADGFVYDRNQAQAYRFVQGTSGPKTITLTTPGAGVRVEIFDALGLYASEYATSSRNGVINLSTMPAGTYVVRVSVDPLSTHPDGTISYNLSVN